MATVWNRALRYLHCRPGSHARNWSRTWAAQPAYHVVQETQTCAWKRQLRHFVLHQGNETRWRRCDAERSGNPDATGLVGESEGVAAKVKNRVSAYPYLHVHMRKNPYRLYKMRHTVINEPCWSCIPCDFVYYRAWHDACRQCSFRPQKKYWCPQGAINR